MAASAFFTEARQHPAPSKHPDKDLSLYLDDIIAERKKEMADDDDGSATTTPATTPATPAKIPAKTAPPFTIGSPITDERKKEMQEDPYLAIAYQLITPLSN